MLNLFPRRSDGPGVPITGQFIDPEFDQFGRVGGPGVGKPVIDQPVPLHRELRSGMSGKMVFKLQAV